MRHVVCHDCRKRYNFDVYDFCPKCGAFTPPKKEWDVDVRGNIVRVDGINEGNHAGSFVHQEVHKEKTARKAKGLDRPHLKKTRSAPASGLKKKADGVRRDALETGVEVLLDMLLDALADLFGFFDL